MANYTYMQERKLTKNMILYPGLFPSQSAKPKYDKDYARNLIIDMMMLGIKLKSFTEVEGGDWLPASYYFALCDADSGLWDMTKIHSLLFRYPGRRFRDYYRDHVRWDNVSGINTDIGFANDRVRYEAKSNPYRKKATRSIDTTTICVRGLEFEVEYSVDSYGSSGAPPSWNYPGDDGEPAEVTIWSCFTEVGNGERIDIDIGKGFEELMEEIEEALVQHVYESSYDGDEF